jgi:hypothetical protein
VNTKQFHFENGVQELERSRQVDCRERNAPA